MKLQPIKMNPAYRYGAMTPWGGEGLKAFGKAIPDSKTGESLEVSVLTGLESRDDEGRTLPQLLVEYGQDMRGTKVGEVFPLLLKLINAQDMLSVQVHPDDAYAAQNEGGKLGKTEAWVILDAAPGAQIVYGVREGVTKEQLTAACEIGGQAVRDCLRFVDVAPGEVYYIPAGMVHALGNGITIMEIQQSSDVTYRFYDWDRVDAQGKARELHIGKGLDVTDVTLCLPVCRAEKRSCTGGERIAYIHEEAFSLERWRVNGAMEMPKTPEHFTLLCALGDGCIKWDEGHICLSKGDCVFVPAEHVDMFFEGTFDLLVCWPGE